MATDPSGEPVDLRAHTAVAASLAADLGIGPSELVARLVEVWLTQVTEATELVVVDGAIATVVPIDSAAPVQTMLDSARIAVPVSRVDRDDSGLLPRLTVAVPGSSAATEDDGLDPPRRTLIAASVLLAEDSAVLDPPTGLAWCGRGGDESLHVIICAEGHHLTVGGAGVDPAVIGATADSLRAFVTAAIHDPSTPVRSLPLVGPAVHDSLLRGCNDTEAPFPGDERLDERVWRWADARPDVVALADGDTTLTYRSLIDDADALADRLRRCGVGVGDIVAISMPRSFELVIAILAVARCRAAYLPLDIAAPPLRNEAIRALTSTTIELVRPDDGGIEIRLSPVTAPPLQVGPDVACVMHTSGSTGHPKAVEVTTRGIQRLISAADVAAFGPQTVMAMVSSPAFDALTFELWGALGNGGRLEVIATEDLVDPRRFADVLADRSVTTMLLTTAVFNTVSAHEPAAFRGLHDLVVGGEALDPGAVARVLPHSPTRLSNVYGPTECACLTTIGPISGIDDAATTVPIGGPLSNTTVDLVDRVGRLVPFGFEGEILIGGPAVGRGYVADPTATAAVFVESPLRPGRHYRTGDIARRLPDGRIDFVGRRDAQIKLRGHRIELGEIERALMSLDQVRMAAVIVQGTGAHGRLIAHVVGTRADVSTPDIRAALATRLSPAMVPAAVVLHDALPMTPSGKLDRRALAGAPIGDPVGAPRGDTAASDTAPPSLVAMQACWAEVLALDVVDPDADFFDLGGNSLLAVELLNHVERRIGVRLRLAALFDARTPVALAAVVDAATDPGLRVDRSDATAPGLPLYPVVGLRARDEIDEPPLWMIHPAGGNHLLYEPLVARLDTTRSILGVDAVGLDGNVAPLDTVDALADHQFRWITAVQPSGPYALAGYSIGGLIGLEVARRLLACGEEVAYLAAIESDLPDAVVGDLFVGRLKAYRRLVAARDLPGVADRLRGNARRRLEALATRRLGVRPSDRQIDENVRLAMVGAFCAYDGEPVDVAIDVILGQDNALADVAAIVAAWERLATGGVTLLRVPGSHDTALLAPAVDAVATVLGTRLDELGASGRGADTVTPLSAPKPPTLERSVSTTARPA